MENKIVGNKFKNKLAPTERASFTFTYREDMFNALMGTGCLEEDIRQRVYSLADGLVNKDDFSTHKITARYEVLSLTYDIVRNGEIVINYIRERRKRKCTK